MTRITDLMRLTFLLVTCFTLSPCSGQEGGSQITSDQMKYFYQTVLSPAAYDRRVRPSQAVTPVTVRVSLYIIKLSDLDLANQEVKVTMYFRQRWTDDRLTHSGEGKMIGGAELSDAIWKPDTMFTSSDEGRVSLTTVPNVFVRISPNGSILQSVKLTQTVTCLHSFNAFPLDSAQCKLQIESYGHSSEDIVYEWQAGGIGIDKALGVHQFSLDTDVTNSTNQIILTVGNFTSLSLGFRLERRAAPYLVKFVLPLIATTVLSMIPVADSGNKKQATLTSFLLTSLLALLINIHVVPQTATAVTAMDAFAVICILFTAVSLVMSLRRGAETEGSTHKLSEKEERVERHVNKLLPIAFASFLLILLIVVVSI